MPDGDPLTPEQRAVVDLPADARAVVVAGPGTGKTHTLVYRAAELVRRDDVGGADVLILSFTNEVVAELQRRLDEHDESPNIRPVTMDSLAGRLAAQYGKSGDSIGFDATVAAAVRILEDSEVRPNVLGAHHIIVDEAQDLVGVRLAFVQALLARCEGGFTVLGDPAQGIYGFSDSKTGAGSPVGVDALLASFPGARHMTLTGDRRSRRPGASPAQGMRDMMLAEASQNGANLKALRRRLRDCDRVTFPELAMILRRSDSSTGVLCRNNGQVLLLSSQLAEAGIRHSVRASATARTAPRWPAVVLGNVDGPTVTKETFFSCAEGRPREWQETAWRAARRVAGDRRGAISMPLLRERLDRLGATDSPEEIGSPPVLSTVHRSKGLEYETCVILDSGSQTETNSEEEARVLFVAMTRGRSATLCLKSGAPPGRLVRRRGRWVLLPWRGEGIIRVELGAGDVEAMLPSEPCASTVADQTYLAEAVGPGDPVILRKESNRYELLHEGKRIGHTGAEFAPFGNEGPAQISDVRIARVRAAPGDPALTTRLGLGGGGLWLVPELVGLGRAHWREDSDEASE